MSKKKSGKKGKLISKEELRQMAIGDGLKHLISSNPNLKNYAVLISNNLDNKKISSFIEVVERKLKEYQPSDEEYNKAIYENLANYIASGNGLKDSVIQILFEESSKGKLDKGVLEKIVEFFKPNKFKGEEYFEKARSAYGDMYDILSQDKVAQNEIPELTKAARAMKMYGFLDVALKSFKAHGMMDDKMYKRLSQELYKNTTIKSEKGMRGLEAYILTKEEKGDEMPQKIAASIIGFIGIMLVIFNSTITGSVIGNNSPVTEGIVGGLMILIALLLFFRPLKKKF